MKVSHSWLQTYFKEQLPDANKLADLFTFHAFEVEEVIEEEKDAVIDVKVLPDRAHYALSHRGIAREVAAITGHSLVIKEPNKIKPAVTNELSITIDDEKLCRRYSGRRVENLTIGQSPTWLREKLEAIGQRSINTIVDATNYVMFDVGQPLHAFDADKIVGSITIRRAEEGEKIDLLPEKIMTANGEVIYKERVLELKGNELVIADEKGPVALAGIKGGLRAAVTENTKNIILESANFDPVSVRKTSTVYSLRNDSSKRFENELSPETAHVAMEEISALIHQLSPKATFGEIVDVYPSPVEPWTVTVTMDYINSLLGIEIKEQEALSILKRMDIKVKTHDKALVLEIPYWRLDLSIPQDIAEEVGRIYGYNKIKPVVLPKVEKPPINKVYYWSEKFKDALRDHHFSEVYTYALTDHGDIEIQNPLASDKGFLRTNLRENMEQALIMNTRNAPLLGLEDIKIFEIGNVFTNEKNNSEHLNLCIGFYTTKSMKQKEKKMWEMMSEWIKQLGDKFGIELKGVLESTQAGVIFEGDFTALVETLPEPSEWNVIKIEKSSTFKPFSMYPFISRDIAVFVPDGISEKEPLNIIEKESGDLLVRKGMFDVFHKQFPDGTKKTSYAFRLVFQSFERTLTDDEINTIMKRITDVMNAKDGWQVR